MNGKSTALKPWIFPKSKADPAVAQGARLAEVDQWEQAIETWQAALPDADEESGGMLRYNMPSVTKCWVRSSSPKNGREWLTQILD
jgi:hypothetical protein